MSKRGYESTDRQRTQTSVMDKISGVASYGALGHVPPLDFQQFHFTSLWSRPKADSQILCRVRDQLVQMSTTHMRSVLHQSQNYNSSSSCCTPKLCRECSMTILALPLLATNPGDATGQDQDWRIFSLTLLILALWHYMLVNYNYMGTAAAAAQRVTAGR